LTTEFGITELLATPDEPELPEDPPDELPVPPEEPPEPPPWFEGTTTLLVGLLPCTVGMSSMY
jgi:hypothetical protein